MRGERSRRRAWGANWRMSVVLGSDKEWEPRKGDAEWERTGETDKGSDARSDGIHDRTQHVKRCSPRNGGTSSSLSMKVAFPWFANNAHLSLCNRERERKREREQDWCGTVDRAANKGTEGKLWQGD